MRKILSFLVSAIMLLTMFENVLAAGTEKADEDSTSASAAEYLSVLGIIDEDELSSIDFEGVVSRSTLAGMVALTAGYSGNNSGKSLFFDVSSETENAAYIAALADGKIIAPGGEFRPEDAALTEDAACWIVRSLGYDIHAVQNGGFPNGHMFMAKKLGLLKGTGLKTGDTLTFSGLFRLLVNALNTEVMRQTVYGSDGYFEVRENITLSYEVFRVFHLRGIVDAVELSALKGENRLNPHYVSVDGELVYIEELDPERFLGYEVDAYCYHDRENGRYVLKYINATERNSVFTVDIDDVISLSGGRLVYSNERGKSQTKSFSPLLPVIFNNASTGMPLTLSLLNGLDGSISFLDNDGDSDTDAVIVRAYRTVVVADVDTSEKLVFDKYDKTGKPIKLDTKTDDPFTIIFNGDGKEISLYEISRGDILSIYESRNDSDQQYIEVHASKEVIEGVIDRISGRNGKTQLTVDGTEYELSDDCKTNAGNVIKTGNSVVLHLDKAGRVADVTFGESSLNIGYIVAADYEKTAGVLEREIVLRIYDLEGVFSDIMLADKCRIDDKQYTGGDLTAIDALVSSASVVYPEASADNIAQPIRFRLNSDGRISFIDTVNKSRDVKAGKGDLNGDNSLYMGEASSSYYYGPSAGHFYFGGKGKFVSGKNTRYMNVPDPQDASADLMEETEFAVPARGVFTDSRSYTLKPFFFTENSLSAGLVITHGLTGDTDIYTKPDYVVRSVCEALGSKGEKVYEITAVGSGGETAFMCPRNLKFKIFDNVSEASDLLLGDVICVSVDKNNDVKDLEFHYRLSTDTGASSFTMNSYLKIAAGFVGTKEEEGMTLVSVGNRENIPNAADSDVMLVPYWSKCGYVVYDKTEVKDERKVYAGTYGDIFAYDDVGTGCSSVIAEVRSTGLPYLIIIIK